MPGVVVDASAVVELLLRTAAGERVGDELRGETASAPAHLDAEVLSALGRLERDGQIDEQTVERGLRHLARAPVTRIPITPLLVDAWALRANLALRDALYVCLARRLNARFLTTDARIAGAPRLGVTVSIVTD